MSWLDNLRPARNSLVMGIAIVALVQTGVLAGMVIDRVRLLSSGREIVLPIIPVDPRDLFRGEYVRLGYEIGTVPVRLLEGPQPAANAPFYVVLERKEGGTWQAIRISSAFPRETSPDRIVLKARAMHNWPRSATGTGSVRVRYGIESYFVPEGQGRKLEDLAREKKLSTLVAVDASGNAAIKGLVIDGKLQYGEPLL